LYRGEKVDNTYLDNHVDDGNTGEWLVDKVFVDGNYQDIAGLFQA